jgi:peptide/nickel transport system permease protein
MTRLVLSRVAGGLVTVWLVSVIVFFGVAVLPGDAASVALGQMASPEGVARLRHEMGLDRPILTRYWEWSSGLVHGNLGRSVSNGLPVTAVIGHRFANTIALAVATLVILIPSSIILGTTAAIRRYRPTDSLLSSLTLIMSAVPEFVVGILLAILLGVVWPVFPAISLFSPTDFAWQHPNSMALPVITLVLGVMAYTTRLVRARVIEVLERPFVQMARLKGTPERDVIRRHVLPNALPPLAQVLALAVAFLLGGVVVVEVVFNYPGIGSTLVEAVAARDITTVESITVVLAAVYILTNLVADICATLMTPRLRTGR